MLHLRNSHWTLLLFAGLWSLSCSNSLTAWSSVGQSKPKDQLDPNVRDWGDYSDLPLGIKQASESDKEGEHGNKRRAEESSSSLAPELDFLAEFTGKANKSNQLMCLFYF